MKSRVKSECHVVFHQLIYITNDNKTFEMNKKIFTFMFDDLITNFANIDIVIVLAKMSRVFVK